MALTLTIYAPTLTAPLVLYESGAIDNRLYERGVSSVARRVDLYTGRDAVASSGTVRTTLDNRDGLLSPDGLFAPRWRDVLLVAAIDNNLVFVGRAERIGEGAAGVKIDVHWRDLVDDFLAQQVTGVPSRIDDANILASTNLGDTLTDLGIVALGLPAVDLWLPERTTTIRKWLIPVLNVLGYSVDWSATITAGTVDAGFTVQSEDAFGNQAGIPRFIDDHKIGDPKWDSGREQVFNLWEGQRRFWDATEQRFESEDIAALGDTRRESLPVLSREYFGDRKARLDTESLRLDRSDILGFVNAVINRRAWPHIRATMTLRGAEAAALSIGDGFVTAFRLGVMAGRGLAGVWRVVGRTVDLLTETTTLYAEKRDGRDADYRAWQTAGGTVTTAADP